MLRNFSQNDCFFYLKCHVGQKVPSKLRRKTIGARNAASGAKTLENTFLFAIMEPQTHGTITTQIEKEESP